MKNLILTCAIFFFPFTGLIAQENDYQLASDCPNYNTFAKNGQIEQIRPLVYEVRGHGTMFLDPAKADSVDLIFQQMGLPSGTTFELVKETVSRLDSTKFFRKYRQFYHGVAVDGGGYTTAFIGPNGPDPCAEAYMLVPHILTGIVLDHNPAVSPTAIPPILEVQNVENAQLLVTHNLTDQCEYRLVWRVTYHKDYPRIAWVDAHTGSLIRSIDARAGHNAPTITYGPQFLNDKTQGATTTLETPDGSVVLYNFDNGCPDNTAPANWPVSAVPSTNNPTEWTTETTEYAYQTFWVTSSVVPLYKSIGVNFGRVNVGNCTSSGAFCIPGSNTDAAFVTIGRLNNHPLALFDIVAHELGHAFMYEFLQYNNRGNQTLHEAISDILGTYIESLVSRNGGIDWAMGDDAPVVGIDLDRNLQTTTYKCFEYLTNHPVPHERGLPLGHWYFLVSQGNAAKGIPALGNLPALNILMESLNLIENNSDIPDLMRASLTLVEDRFGRCSNQFLAVARAWEAICVPTGFAINGAIPSCNFTIYGPSEVCEETDFAQFCVQGGLPNGHYRWSIIGRKSTGYVSLCGMQGNTQDGCDCLTLIDFPKYPYYPQYITIEVYSPTTGPQFIQRKKVKLVDCDNDDPSCSHALGNAESENRHNTRIESEVPEYARVRAFDYMGRQIFEQSTNKLSLDEIQHHGMVVLVFYGKNGEIVKVSKVVLLD